MGELWGISGSQFLVMYGAGLVAALAMALLWRWRVRRPPARVPAEPLGVAEVALLAGGRWRAAAAVVAGLIDSGIVQVSGGGSLTAAVTTAADPVELAVLRAIDRTPRPAGSVVAEVADGPAVLGIRDALVRRALLVGPATAGMVLRRSVLGLYLLLAAGLVRHVAAVRHGDPVGYLTVSLLVTAVLAIALRRRPIPLRTVAGDRLLVSVYGGGPGVASPLLRPTVTGSGARVALGGFDNFPDPAVRNQLVHGAVMIGMLNSGNTMGI